MVTDKIKGEELYRDLKKGIAKIRELAKKKRDEIRKPFIGKRGKPNKVITSWMESEFYFNSPNHNRWFIVTKMKGDPSKPNVINHMHCTYIDSKGSNNYVIYRGFRTRPNGEVGGYIVTVSPHIVKKIKEKCIDLSNYSSDIVLSKIFDNN